MIYAMTAPIPSAWIAADDEDDAELYYMGVGNTRQDAIEDYFERCLRCNPDYISDSPEFDEFIKNY